MKTVPLIALIIMNTLTAAHTGMAQGGIDRTVRPAPQAVPKIKLPDVQKFRLKNGLEVWVVEQHELPTVAFNLVLDAGAERDPLDKSGIASMTADVLDEGTTTKDALQIADALDFLGASLSVRSSVDGTFLSLTTLTKHMEQAVRVFADVLTNPTFPDSEFERLRKQRLTALLQQKDQPATIASLAFNHIIYGGDHPYGNDVSGSESSLTEMKRDDLVQFYQTYYRPNNAVLIVVGDVRVRPLSNLLETELSGWERGTAPAMVYPAVPKPKARRIYVIDKPGAAQSEIRIGYPALSRSTSDYFPVTIMNRALGGQFSSRLNMNLREKHGFSYGVRSSFSFNKQPGPFTAGGAVTTAKTDSALKEFFFELERLANEGMDNDELTFIKKGLTGSFALSFETPSQIAASMQNIVLYGLPDNYYEDYLQNINGVTLEQANAAARRYLRPSDMAVVVVGDWKIIGEGIEALGMGSVELRSATGDRLGN